MCGAKGAISTVSGSRTARFEQSPSSLRQIMKAATEVLNEKFSMSSDTFLIVLCSVFSSLSVGSASVTSSRPSRS